MGTSTGTLLAEMAINTVIYHTFAHSLVNLTQVKKTQKMGSPGNDSMTY